MQFGPNRKTGEVKLGVNRVLKWQRRIRNVFFVLIAVAIVWLFVQVGKYTVAPNNDAMQGTFDPGTTVVYDRLFDWHDGMVPFFGVKDRGILRGNIVIFLKEGLEVVDAHTGERKTGSYYGISRVIGLPGDSMAFTPKGVVVRQKGGDGAEEKLFPAPHDQGSADYEEIPPDRFFVLNDNIGSDVQDSRHFGYILGTELRGKVLVTLKLW